MGITRTALAWSAQSGDEKGASRTRPRCRATRRPCEHDDERAHVLLVESPREPQPGRRSCWGPHSCGRRHSRGRRHQQPAPRHWELSPQLLPRRVQRERTRELADTRCEGRTPVNFGQLQGPSQKLQDERWEVERRERWRGTVVPARLDRLQQNPVAEREGCAWRLHSAGSTQKLAAARVASSRVPKEEKPACRG